MRYTVSLPFQWPSKEQFLSYDINPFIWQARFARDLHFTLLKENGLFLRLESHSPTWKSVNRSPAQQVVTSLLSFSTVWKYRRLSSQKPGRLCNVCEAMRCENDGRDGRLEPAQVPSLPPQHTHTLPHHPQPQVIHIKKMETLWWPHSPGAWVSPGTATVWALV